MNDIEKYGKQELAWNGKRVQASEEEIVKILAPMFASFPTTKADRNTVDNYVSMLRDIAPDVLAAAVLRVKATCKFFPTIAEIRDAAELGKREPGPRSDVDPTKLKDVPVKMFRLPEDEDRRQRLERLRETKEWSRFYGA